jgi:hypothetical protein
MLAKRNKLREGSSLDLNHSRRQECTVAIRNLQQFVHRSVEEPPEGPEAFERFERALRAQVAEIEREALREVLLAATVDLAEVWIDGVHHRRVLRSTATYATTAGPVSVARTLYVRSGTKAGKAICPLELRMGIVRGEYTPWAARQMVTLMTTTSSAEAEGIFREMGVFHPSRANLDRLPKELSARWESRRIEFEDRLRTEETVPKEAAAVGVSIDGVLVPSREGSPRPAGARGSGPLAFREVGCAAVCLYDRAGERLSTFRYGRAPEEHKASLKGQVRAELDHILRAREELKLVLLSDGAEDHWNFFENLAAEWEARGKVFCLLDFWHACEHLKAALDVRYGEGTPQSKAQFEKLKTVLKEDSHGAEKVIRSLDHCKSQSSRSARDKLGTVIAFFRRNRTKMQYAAALRKNLPIGSGVVEATCKTLATQRLKCSGMRWSHRGAQAILTLRALHQSDDCRWDRGWNLLLSTYQASVVATRPEGLRSAA